MAHTIYFAILFAYSTFAWWLFYFKFDLIESPKKVEDIPENKVGSAAVAEDVSAN
tara:strand:- start:31 stop:195 length:165 start_codon:yes stop_codon:yes gene_type:complete